MEAAATGVEGLRALRLSLGPVDDHNSESVVTMLLAFRRLNAWEDMRSLVNEMPVELAEVWLVGSNMHWLSPGWVTSAKRSTS